MNQKRTKLFNQIINFALVIVIVGLLGWLSQRYKTEFDWTYGHRNTLTTQSQKLLKTMPDPIHFYAFIYGSASNKRQDIQQAVDRYQRFKSNITVKYIDPTRNPQKVKQFHITQPGQVVVEYDGRKETLTSVSEPKISHALERLSSKNIAHVVFLTGDGERSPDDKKQTGYSSFSQTLISKGMRVDTVNLALHPKIPANTAALVIASPTSELLPGEQKIIQNYVKHGGNLLWLADTDNPPYLKGLARQLGIAWQNGYAIFPNYQALGTGNPGIYLAAAYPRSPITKHLHEITVFPLVRSLKAAPLPGWHRMPLLETTKDSWLEVASHKMQGVIQFDPKAGDLPGPLMIGLAESRKVTVPAANPAKADKTAKAHKGGKSDTGKTADHKDPKPAAKPRSTSKQQRIVMIGDADFLSNGYIKVLGNRDLGVSIMNWLASRNKSLDITIPNAPDRNLYLPTWESWAISIGFIAVLPFLLLVFGIGRWFIRRRR